MEGQNERGVALFREGRLDQALLAFDRALVMDPRRAATLSNRANALFRAGRAEEGLADQEKALAREPRSAGSWLSKATIERALGRLSQARRSLLDLLSLQSPPDGRLLEQARSLFADLERQGVPRGRRPPSAFCWAACNTRRPGGSRKRSRISTKPLAGTPSGHRMALQGRRASRSRPRAEAAQAYDEGLTADPGEVRLLTGLGRARARLGDLDVAAGRADRALDLAEGESKAHRTPAECGRHGPSCCAPAALAPEPEGPPHETHPSPPALAPDPEQPMAERSEDWANKGRAALEAGRADEAVSCFARALELDKGDLASWMGQAESFAHLGRFEDAVAPYDEALKRSPRLREAWIGRGLALHRLGRFDDAISSFVKVLQTDPTDAEALYQKAGAEEQAGSRLRSGRAPTSSSSPRPLTTLAGNVRPPSSRP